MDILLCANCGYEYDEVDDIGLCQTCRKAYDKGLQRGYEING